MKTLSTLLLYTVSSSILCAGGGSGPWADGTYYPGNLNGKYVGIVTGNNISGVVGFAIVDGAPPFRTTEQQSAAESAAGALAITVNQSIGPDILQNYFSIFVEGRTYTGVTMAGIDTAGNQIAGALQGQNPASLLAYTATPAFPGTPPGGAAPGVSAAADALSIVNRGLSGGFTAKIKSKKNVFRFKGTGQLSTPANPQTVTITAVPLIPSPLVIPPGSPFPPAGTVTSETMTGQVTTHSTPFNISGIRTSFIANNPSSLLDAIELAPPSQGGN